MSFYDDASLVFLPSGGAGKDGKAYSMKPTNGDGDFTFSRGSNLTATRVDSNGLIEKGRENLLLQSNSFDTTWTTFNASVTSGQSGYDGSNDAWLLNATGASGVVRQTISLSGVQTFSIYAKQGVADAIEINSFSNVSLKVNLTNGSVITSGSANIDSSVTSISNGYYRITITANGSATIWRVYISKTSGSVTSGDNIYIQDAQLEQGLVATEYIESGASTGLAGILEDSPRFDYSGGASCPSLLLEPSRTNLVPISEGIPEDTNEVTLTENYGTSPEGLQNSLKVQKNGDSSNDRIFPIDNYNATLVSGTSYSVSAFVKNIDVDGITTLGCRLGSGGTLFRLGYEWNGSSLTKSTFYAAGTRTNEILEDYGNGWWRIGFSFVADNTQGGIELDIDRANSSATTSIETYGWQLEEGSYPTSYIPNHSGGSVTRGNDDVNDFDISSMLTGSSFTWFLDLNDYIGSDANNINIWIQSTSSVRIEFRVLFDGYRIYYNSIAGGSTFPIAGSTTANKFCVSYDGNDYRLYVDGTLEATTASVGDSGWDKIRNSVLAPLPLKQMQLFPTALSTTDCEILTGATSYESFSAMATALNYTTYE